VADSREQEARVDDLRQRLRELGYLDAGVDRFVLAPAHGARRPTTIALLASLRTGVLAALLMGPAAAIGLAGRLPGLVTGPRDALVIAAYLGALFGAAVAAAAFTASVAVGILARRRPASAARHGRSWAVVAGSLVTVLCLAYLTLWWQTANAGLGWTAPAWTLFALAVAVSISLLLGHAVVLTALAVVVVGAGTTDAAHGVPGSSWRFSLTAGVLAFGGAAALLVLTAPRAAVQPERPPLTVVSSGLRLRIVAVDGVDVQVFDELVGAGRVPALGRVFQAAAARLDGPADDDGAAEADPARTWTTVATGQPADVHGVRGLETRRVAGVRGTIAVADRSPLGASLRAVTDLVRLTRPSIASGHERREMTFWETAGEAGLRIAVVNWWATWPARSDAGLVITDRATVRLERGGELDAEIAPAALYPTLRDQWPEIRRRAAALAESVVDGSLAPGIRAVLRRSAELDAMQLQLAGTVTSPQPDLLAVYLPGLDIAQYSLLRRDGGLGLSASDAGQRVDAVRAYYTALDRLLAPVLQPREGEMLMVVTASGRVGGAGAGRLGLVGPAARSGAQATGSLVDVAPTALHVLGVPISRRLAGQPLSDLLAPEFAARYPVRFVASYGPPNAGPVRGQGQPLDQEMIDRLRSLGYVR
jgi:hypothetical protein